MESRSGDSGRSADASAARPAADQEQNRGRGEDATARAEQPRRRSRPAQRTRRTRRPRLAMALALLLVVAAGIYALSSLGPVRTVLRQSFTNETKPTVDFYFNGAPYVSGEWLEVPLGVLNTPQAGTYAVRLWTVDAVGKVQSTGTAKLSYAQGHGTENVNLLLRGTGQIVFAQLVGTSLTVHYRYEGSPLGTVSPSASSTG